MGIGETCVSAAFTQARASGRTQKRPLAAPSACRSSRSRRCGWRLSRAGFTPDEADKLRRAMATFKQTQGVGVYRERLIGGMVRRGYDPELAERVFKQIEGFGSYGFPESHAASFAHLAYASSWLKCHHPAVFAAALLNSQPMGFYAPAQIVRDAQQHAVEVRPLDINASDWDSTARTRAHECRRTRAQARPAFGFRPPRGRGAADR